MTVQTMTALEIDSQTQLLSRLQFVTRFGSHFVQVTGLKGAGKSWLSERYLEKWATDPTQVLLVCQPEQPDYQQRIIILRQLAKDGIFNESDALLDSLQHLITDQKLHVLIVIDNAELLGDALLQELWDVVAEANVRANWQCNVLLFAQKNALSKKLAHIGQQSMAPLELEVTALTVSEVQQFINMLIAEWQLAAAARRHLKQLASQVPSLPGVIVALLDEPEPAAKTTGWRRLNLLLLVLALMLLGGAAAFWVFERQASHFVATLDANKTNVDQSVITARNLEPVEDEVALPSNAIVAGIKVGHSDKPSRIVVPDKIIDEMIVEQKFATQPAPSITATVATQPNATPSANTAPLESGIEKLKQRVKLAIPDAHLLELTAEPALALKDEPQISAQELAQIEPIAPQAPVNEVELTAADLEFGQSLLLAVAPSSYAIQLAALKSLAATADFLQSYQLLGRVTLYQSERAGVNWIIVLMGEYENIQQANQAILQLPAPLNALNPWAKPFRQIHREIEQARNSAD